MNYKLLSLAAAMLLIFACEVSDDVNDVKDDLADVTFEISSYNPTYGINDTLVFRGSYSEGIEPSVSISGDSDFELGFAGATETELMVFIPAEVEAGDYDITFTLGDKEITNDAFGDPLPLKVQDRAVITHISSNEFAAGTEIILEGGPFINNTDDNSREPQIWFMKTGYTNTVSEVTVSEDAATITFIADADLPAGEYKLSVTTGQDSEYYTSWSNEVIVTVTE